MPESVTKVELLLKQRPGLLNHGMDVILATKLSWWETGHHTNQGKMKPYLREALTKGVGQCCRSRLESGSVGSVCFWAGSISERYGSGSFYHQAKIVRKILIPTVL
jgi:hypothetical protein